MRQGYNTFVVMDCRLRKPVLVTSSARKARGLLEKGIRVEVWNGNALVERIYAAGKEQNPMRPYVDAEREYIARKQN